METILPSLRDQSIPISKASSRSLKEHKEIIENSCTDAQWKSIPPEHFKDISVCAGTVG